MKTLSMGRFFRGAIVAAQGTNVSEMSQLRLKLKHFTVLQAKKCSNAAPVLVFQPDRATPSSQ